MRWAIGALVASCLAGAACNASPPPPRDSIRFRHGPHLAESIGCPRCHAAALATEPARSDAGGSAAAGRAALLPSQADCQTCHTRPAERECRFCHTRPRNAATYPREPSRIRFEHASHVERTSGNCVRCHGTRADDEVVSGYEPDNPPMDSCTDSTCHAEDMSALRCSSCHASLHDYELAELQSVRHPAGWSRRHGRSARTDDALCGQCHDPSFCDRCHTPSSGMPLELVEPMGVDRDFVHRGDFAARHSTEVRLESGTCARCHGPSFCDECHRRAGVGGSVGNASAHPPGWLSPFAANGHARAARRDLMACAACHESDAEQTCVPCHRVGGVTGNPHPPGFATGVDPLRHGMCRSCHAP